VLRPNDTRPKYISRQLSRTGESDIVSQQRTGALKIIVSTINLPVMSLSPIPLEVDSYLKSLYVYIAVALLTDVELVKQTIKQTNNPQVQMRIVFFTAT
jgi:hypothetical protein